jgi:hypothetical protein
MTQPPMEPRTRRLLRALYLHLQRWQAILRLEELLRVGDATCSTPPKIREERLGIVFRTHAIGIRTVTWWEKRASDGGQISLVSDVGQEFRTDDDVAGIPTTTSQDLSARSGRAGGKDHRNTGLSWYVAVVRLRFGWLHSSSQGYNFAGNHEASGFGGDSVSLASCGLGLVLWLMNRMRLDADAWMRGLLRVLVSTMRAWVISRSRSPTGSTVKSWRS